MRQFIRYEWGVAKRVLAATWQEIKTQYAWVAGLAILAAVAGWVLNDPESRLDMTVRLSILTAALLAVAVWLVMTFRVPFLTWREEQADYARLKQLLSPSVKIHEVVVHDSIHKQIEPRDEWWVKYVQVRVENIGTQSITLRPHVIKIQRFNEANGQWETSTVDSTIALFWSMDHNNAKELDAGIPWAVNVCLCSSRENRLRFEPDIPTSLYRYFNERGRYRFLVAIGAKDRQAARVLIEVTNGFEWDRLSAEVIAEEAAV